MLYFIFKQFVKHQRFIYGVNVCTQIHFDSSHLNSFGKIGNKDVILCKACC